MTETTSDPCRPRGRYLWLLLTLLALVPAVACGGPPEVTVEPAADAGVRPIGEVEARALLPNGQSPLPGVVTGGQPSAEQLEALAHAGFRTVVDLRGPDEDYARDEEQAAAAELGLEYVSIPVAGAEDLTEETARALARVLDDAAVAPVAIHCASGNRVGALLAVEAAWVDGVPPEQALALGRSGGLTRLEPRVRELLGLDAEPQP